MIRYKGILMYDGTNYNGFQSQLNGPSIQDEVERVLSKICNQPIKIIASGRTDAKVHAYGHVFHFDVDKHYTIYKFKYAINGLLPKDIQLIDLEEVDELFHARYCVASKRYDYLIKTWMQIREMTLESIAPKLIHEEGDIIKRSLRDVFTPDIDEICVEGERVLNTRVIL